MSTIEELEIKLAELDAEFNAPGSTMRQDVWTARRIQLLAQLDAEKRAARTAEATEPTRRLADPNRSKAPPDKDGRKTPVMWRELIKFVDEMTPLIREHVGARMKPLEERIAELESRKSLEYRGTFRTDTEYGLNDLVTHSGQLWLCQQQGTRKKPGDADAWRLVSKTDLAR